MDKIPSIYHFDPVRLFYTGSSDAHIGPMGDVQLPAFSTLGSPGDVPAGKVAIATSIHGDGWAFVDDNRAVPIYRTADGSLYEFGSPLPASTAWSGIGDVPPGLTVMPKPDGCYTWDGSNWVFDLTLARAAASAEIEAKRLAALASPFAYGDHQFNADTGSIAQIASMAQLAAVAKVTAQPYSAIWTAVDGTDVPLDEDGVIALAMAAAARQPAIQQIAARLKAQIAAAQDEEALAAVAWPQ
ncbi:MAG TPA: DUF4376 domain-containing protein [Paraburkholderia sp.]|jgi:hypothetical protein